MRSDLTSRMDAFQGARQMNPVTRGLCIFLMLPFIASAAYGGDGVRHVGWRLKIRGIGINECGKGRRSFGLILEDVVADGCSGGVPGAFAFLQ